MQIGLFSNDMHPMCLKTLSNLNKFTYYLETKTESHINIRSGHDKKSMS